MNTVDLEAWGKSPKLRRCSLQARAAWLLLAMCGYPVAMSDFLIIANTTPVSAGAVLAELMEAGLVEMHGLAPLNPSFEALMPDGDHMVLPTPTQPDSDNVYIH